MEIKRKFYIFSFTVFGLLFGFLIAEVAQLIYMSLLLNDYAAFSFGMTWAELVQFYNFLRILLVVFCGMWGFAGGKYWWNQIYVLKKYDKRWKNFIK